jgi:hypothetical protein
MNLKIDSTVLKFKISMHTIIIMYNLYLYFMKKLRPLRGRLSIEKKKLLHYYL